ncbi:50S ribosomal protein L3 [Candidatus Omnitrophota bacterium]
MDKVSGKKIGMTHIYTEEGKRRAVTVIETEPSAENKPGAGLFKAGDFVDVSGISKGKGFQGGMKRWNWSGTPQTHGSMSHRRVGSIGASASPSRVLKGKHMPGHMGNQRLTVQNLKVFKSDEPNSLLVVIGAVPGHRNCKLFIGRAKKKPVNKAAQDKEPEAQAKKPEVKPKGKAK